MTLGTAELGYVRELVWRRTANVLDADKGYLVEARLGPLARREGFASIDDLVSRLRQDGSGALHELVVDAMTTNETSWFRDVRPFDALVHHVVPELIAARADRRQLTIWSAACSSGQEPYTIAMLLREHFPELTGWNVRIIASDISAEMLGRAATGRYSQLEVNRGLPAPLLLRWFHREGHDWQIDDRIREMVEFRVVNLIEPWPFVPEVDVLLLRNVLIYFDVESKKRVLSQVRRVLRPDGVLFLGAAETTLNLDGRFERCAVDGSSFYRPVP